MTVLVLGIGNDWRGDDAAGLEVARRLCAAGLRAIAWERDPSNLIDAWEQEPAVILVDAVRSGAAGGTVHRLDASAGALPARLFRGSTHHLSVAEAVELARCLGRLPARVEFIGIEGRRFEAGVGLTPEVARAVDDVAAQLRRRLAPPQEARRMRQGRGAA